MNKKRFISLALCAVMAGSTLALSSCNLGGASSSDLKFWVYGDSEELAVYEAMTKKFNETYGAANGIKVNFIPQDVGGGYNDLIMNNSRMERTCPDVCVVDDSNFKKWVASGYLANMDSYFDAITDIDYSQTYATMINRMRYDRNTGTSDLDDPLYGMPLDSKAAALYYNETLLEKAGIIVISVDAEDMDAFNGGDFADKRGKTLNQYKAEYPDANWDCLDANDGKIPAKGYFRSDSPYTEASGDSYFPIDASELAIFNNRIAMSWDEVEDLAMEFTPSYNEADASKYGTLYGYFTECWFSYGWSVGGDCLQDLTGNGDWDFSLLDDSANYVVAEGKTYTGHYTGTVYQAGETLDFADKFNIPQGAVMKSDGNGGYTYNNAAVSLNADVLAAETNGTLQELPSMKDAFIRYLRLGTAKTAQIEGSGGLKISPNPNIFTEDMPAVRYFYNGQMALWIDYAQYMSYVAERATFDWDVAPLPIYKEYDTDYMNFDPYVDEVKVQGKAAGHSNVKALVSAYASTKKDKAAKFIAWMAGEEGSKVRAAQGAFPNQASLVDDIQFKNYAPQNVRVFAEELEYARPGDWWYLSNDSWIKQWATDLNTHVRNDSGMTYDQWRNGLIAKVNNYLKTNY